MTASVATVPAELLYWGLLPPGSGDAQAQRFRFERVLPVPVEQLQLASATLRDRSTVLVGIERERLRAHLAGRADISPQTWELLPAGVPPHLADHPEVPSAVRALNLLHGEFEPAPRRQRRRTTLLVAQGALALVVLCVLLGAERRHRAAEAHVLAQRQATSAALATVVPPMPGGLKPELRLTMEVRRLEQAARDPAAGAGDVPQLLQSLWRVWPRDLRVQVDTLGANADRVVIRGRVAGLADAERLATACAALAVPDQRFRAEPLQAQQDERGASFLLTLVRTADGVRP